MIYPGLQNSGFNPGNGLGGTASGYLLTYTFKNQPDGKILVGGNFSDYDGVSTNSLTRINPDGSIDSTFNPCNFNDGYVRAIDLLPDGRICVGGQFNQFNGNTTNYFVILNSDGTLNQQFPVGFNNRVRDIKVQPDGKILIGGNFGSFNGNGCKNIVRLNTNGTFDTSFITGVGFNNNVYSIQVESDGNILVGGDFTNYDGVSANRIIRLDPNGTILNTFGGGFNGRVQRIVLQPDGKILVGGQFNDYNGTSTGYMIRLNKNGTVDTTFDFNSWVIDMYVQQDGRIVVGGQFDKFNAGTIGANQIIRLNPSGTYDGSFNYGGGFHGNVNRITELPDGNLLVGGWFDDYDGNTAPRITSIYNLDSNYSEQNNFQYVYSGVSCIVQECIPVEVLNYTTYIIGSNVELSSGDTVSVYTLGSPSRKQCVIITSEFNIFETPTYVYDQTYESCELCFSENTVVAGVVPCSEPESEPIGFIVSNQYQIGDIFSVGPVIFIGEGPSELVFNDCFKIVDIIPFENCFGAPQIEIIEYQPQESCEACQSCVGLYYGASDCSDAFLVFKSHQILNLGDAISFNNNCFQVVDILPPTPFSPYPAGLLTDAPVVTSTVVFSGDNNFTSCQQCNNALGDGLVWQNEIDGDGSINFLNQYEVDILGNNNGEDGRWSYIKVQMPVTGNITFNWEYTSTDPDSGEDWGFYYVSSDEPFADNYIDFINPTGFLGTANGDSGQTTIYFNAGDWVSIGVYSTDGALGPGLLSILFSPFNLYTHNTYDFVSCDGEVGTITLPLSARTLFHNVTQIPYVEITSDGLDTMPIGEQDDDFIEIPLPTEFNVDFLCNNYNSVFLSTNAYLTFGGGSTDCCFAIPNGIPSNPGLPGVYLSTAYSDFSLEDLTDGMDDYLINWYSGTTDGGNKFIVRFEGTYLGYSGNPEQKPLIFSFVFYKNNSSYFDLVIQDNTIFYDNNPTGGLSDGINGGWIKSFNSSSQRSYRISSTCPTFKANFGTTPTICGKVGQSSNNNTLGQLYSDFSETYVSCPNNYETFDYTGDYQTFVAPVNGTYVIETWGAQGGSDANQGGLGGYAIGSYNLTAGEELYVYVGGKGQDGAKGDGGGFNGGGNAGPTGSSGAGGGATDVRYGGTNLSNRIIVAGGAGGGGATGDADGGSGGGLNGINGNVATGGSQTSGGSGSDPGTLGLGGNANADGGGGGGGYYGGGAGGDVDGGGAGGSSYIGGVNDGTTIDGNSVMPDPNGGTMTGRQGDGFAKISWTITNGCTNVYKITVRDCSTGVIEYFGMEQSMITFIQENGFIFSNGTPKCYELLDVCEISYSPIYTPTYFYVDCQHCKEPLKRGNETIICYTCNSDINNGVVRYYTGIQPHPIWTNQYGKAVELVDMIVLGGPNGLNN